MLKKYFFLLTMMLVPASVILAQDFITRGKIEFEIKRNNKLIYSDADRARNNYLSALPDFDVSYRELIFAWNRSVYIPGRESTRSSYVSKNSVYTDINKQQVIRKTENMNEMTVYEDSLKPIRWKLENETRKIAGFQCRKAIGRIYDSVYVVAFYAQEIVPQGGPELFSGLPGMILGIAIPRMHTTWFATKVELAGVDESVIVPPTIKKGKVYTKREYAELLFKKYKENGWWKDVTVEKVMENVSGYLL